MIIRTLELACDHDHPDVCMATVEGQPGESRATPLIRAARKLGWVCSDGRQYCPDHKNESR